MVLGQIHSPVTSIIRDSGCEVIESTSPINLEFLQRNVTDFVVVYGYRNIIQKPVIDHYRKRIINLHISLLPWNRGADPNLWSFLEDSPKGVTIYHIDEGLDTGDIIVQKELFFDESRETSATTYKKISDDILHLFKQHWLKILHGKKQGHKQLPGGSFHQLKDKKRFEYLLSENRWDTPVKDLVGKALEKHPMKRK